MAKKKSLRSPAKLLRWLWVLVSSNPRRPSAFLKDGWDLLRHANSTGYLHWPSRISDHIRKRKVLDVGCGKSLHSIGFLYEGAVSYTGIDPTLDLRGKFFKDCSECRGVFRNSPWSQSEIMSMLKSIDYLVGTTADLDASQKWDAIVMHNVTEHLMEIEKDFAIFARLLNPGGILAFQHPNYYAWGGHHMRPRTIDEIIPNHPDQAHYIDWNYVRFNPQWPDKILKRQNRIRPTELRALVERHFRIRNYSGRLT